MKIETAKRASVRGADGVESWATLRAIIDLTIKQLFHLFKEIFITLLFIYSR